jgi:hypothetical protein
MGRLGEMLRLRAAVKNSVVHAMVAPSAACPLSMTKDAEPALGFSSIEATGCLDKLDMTKSRRVPALGCATACPSTVDTGIFRDHASLAR